jgi:hypothetical protein
MIALGKRSEQLTKIAWLPTLMNSHDFFYLSLNSYEIVGVYV